MKLKTTGYFKQLTESRYGLSSGRWAFLFSIILANIIVWYTWLFVCIWTRSIVDIPNGVVMAYTAAQGLAFGGKAVQSFAERPSNNSFGVPTPPRYRTGEEGENGNQRCAGKG
uniref:Uncharacterized protein n=1 Tax=viral metagenome TaxID=1070528 RepID=A0A6M3X779_9ZZZZ